MSNRARLFVLTGPSCAGKSPLVKALRREAEDAMRGLEEPVCYTSRAPRAGEEDGEDYHFRTREEIEGLRDDSRYVVVEVRNDVQAMDLDEVRTLLEKGKGVLYEGNVRLAAKLVESDAVEAAAERISVFLAPLTRREIERIQAGRDTVENAVTELMRHRLLRRAGRKSAYLSLPQLEDLETRARSAFGDLCRAHEFDHVLPCHDGEDSDHWDLLPCTVGAARRAVEAVAGLLTGRSADGAFQRWSSDLIETAEH